MDQDKSQHRQHHHPVTQENMRTQWYDSHQYPHSYHGTPAEEYAGFTWTSPPLQSDSTHFNSNISPVPAQQPLRSVSVAQWPTIHHSHSYFAPLLPIAMAMPPPPVPSNAASTPVLSPAATSSTTKFKSTPRRTLTDEERQSICEYSLKHPKSRQIEIGAIFGVERSTVSKTISKVLKLDKKRQKSPTKKASDYNPPAKRSKPTDFRVSESYPPTKIGTKRSIKNDPKNGVKTGKKRKYSSAAEDEESNFVDSARPSPNGSSSTTKSSKVALSVSLSQSQSPLPTPPLQQIVYSHAFDNKTGITIPDYFHGNASATSCFDRVNTTYMPSHGLLSPESPSLQPNLAHGLTAEFSLPLSFKHEEHNDDQVYLGPNQYLGLYVPAENGSLDYYSPKAFSSGPNLTIPSMVPVMSPFEQQLGITNSTPATVAATSRSPTPHWNLQLVPDSNTFTAVKREEITLPRWMPSP